MFVERYYLGCSDDVTSTPGKMIYPKCAPNEKIKISYSLPWSIIIVLNDDKTHGVIDCNHSRVYNMLYNTYTYTGVVIWDPCILSNYSMRLERV